MASKGKEATAPYVRGTQDIRENQKTFQFFWDATVWSIVSIFAVLIILAYFFTGGSGTPPAH